MVPVEEDLLIDMALIPNLLENRDRSRITEVFSDKVLLHFLKRRTTFLSFFEEKLCIGNYIGNLTF